MCATLLEREVLVEVNYKFVNTDTLIELPDQYKHRSKELKESNYAVSNNWCEDLGTEHEEIICGS